MLLVVALGFVAWDFYSRNSQKEIPASAATNSPTVSPAVAAVPSPSPSPGAAAAATAGVAKASQPTVPSPVESAPPTKPTATASVSIPSQSLSPAPRPGTFVVRIKAREDSWLSVSIDGEVSTHGTLTAPAERSVRAAQEITIKAGNIGALDFEFNGKKLPPQGGAGEVKTLTFDANGLRPPAPKPEEPAQLP
jgi:hypothetical protein